jgi:hypothetical protein
LIYRFHISSPNKYIIAITTIIFIIPKRNGPMILSKQKKLGK